MGESLSAKPVLTLNDAEEMRLVRNSCRSFMTRNENEILPQEQQHWFQTFDRKAVYPFLFLYQEQVAGYGLVRKIDGKCWISGGLLPAFRHLGLGQDLFGYLSEFAGKPCYLEVKVGNTIAQSIYERLGFIELFRDHRIVTMARGLVLYRPEDNVPPKPPVQELVAPVSSNPASASWSSVPSTDTSSITPPITPPSLPTMAPQETHFEHRVIGSLDLRRTPKRVLFAPLNYDHPQIGMRYAFHALFGKENVFEFDYLERERHGQNDLGRQFVEAAKEFQPDWVFCQFQNTNVIQANYIEELKRALPKTVVTHWMGDAGHAIGSYLSSICKVADVTFISSVGQKQLFMDAGARRVEYMQIGLDWEEDVLGVPDWTPGFAVPDVVFIGNYYGSAAFTGTDQRIAAVRHLKGLGVAIGVVGNGWPGDIPVVGTCTVKQQVHVWKRAKVGLSINHFNDIEQYYSDRQIIAMASGRPVVSRYVPSLEKDFEDQKHTLFFRTHEELFDNVQKLLSNEAYAERIGRAGRSHVMQNHTWINRFFNAIPVVSELMP